ncbi:hypothetical protein H2200_004628 [Cladophialophora chaetospira]|uniref:ABA 3 protein n=1 Tax=Cladophialophora chaetospira TaxID=386627 RepID=A0AA38XE48_9EURO|nr:hypothetical protein H2200_004628 [Cladophialophora chaetospira]
MTTQSPATNGSAAPKLFIYPPILANDLASVDLPDDQKKEALTCAWEYVRCVIPQYTNVDRYVAFARIVLIGVIAEYRGDMLDLDSEDRYLFGYDLDELFTVVYGGMGEQAHRDLACEFRTFLLVNAEKSDKDKRAKSELFRRYVNALAVPPKNAFRLRDCDALVRFTIAAALACNELEQAYTSFTEDQLQILGELGAVMYDAVAYHKHRAEGEVNSTFAYAEGRLEAFRRYREVLWALDVVWTDSPALRCVINFMRPFTGPIHMMMHRYRFVEDKLTIGNPENEHVVNEARKNVKLWHHIDAPDVKLWDFIDASDTPTPHEQERYQKIMDRSDRLMFPGFAAMLDQGDKERCKHCNYRTSYGAQVEGEFGGLRICDNCKGRWRRWIDGFERRAARAFPELQPWLG